MNKPVLILGGQGRIGSAVAEDLLKYTEAKIIVTGREKKHPLVDNGVEFFPLDLADINTLKAAIQNVDLVIHCAGPFHYRDGRVLKSCIQAGVNYIDVSDHRSFYQQVLPYREAAKEAGITAILNTGIFPGISNSMVRQGVEKFEQAERIHLSYVVAGSGGAGITVMRTTFLGLRKSFTAWINKEWKSVLPYSDREVVEFGKPYGKVGVYWFDVPETYTFTESFNVDTVVTKFGSVPDFYNHLTWIVAHVFPISWIESNKGIEFFSRVSYLMTTVTDKFSGIGVAMRAEITGKKAGESFKYCAIIGHENTAIAAGCGTGSVAELVLKGELNQPGIWPIEQILPSNLFRDAMNSRGIEIKESWQKTPQNL